jgi:hypothetical protein
MLNKMKLTASLDPPELAFPPVIAEFVTRDSQPHLLSDEQLSSLVQLLDHAAQQETEAAVTVICRAARALPRFQHPLPDVQVPALAASFDRHDLQLVVDASSK